MSGWAAMTALPIDAWLGQIVSDLAEAGNLVIEAAPGAGKTTRVPGALLASGLAGDGEILVLEPRRLAARLAARRVAVERGEQPGETVGYQVRFEEVAGPRTRLRFLTEGMLTRRLLSDPRLARVQIVILDEFHERHLQSDLVLALLRRLQKTERPDLRLVVMSATLDSEPIVDYLGTAKRLTIPGRQFEVRIEHQPHPDERPLAEQVAAALARLLDAGPDGDVLVFLPGAAEIRRAREAIGRLAAGRDLLVLPLHGDLPVAAQDQAVRPADRRKVILSTNVAESSVTIEGIVAVIDSGLARIAGHSPWSGIPTLEVSRISQASAIQRAGRAGRTRSGVCLRLYTQQDFLARPPHQSAEIAREDLAEPALQLHAAGIADLTTFEWFEAPPAPALAAAGTLLARLGAINSDGRLTPVGRQMLRYPVHPRQARLLVEAGMRGVYDEACGLAALIGERDIIARTHFDGGRHATRPPERHSPSSHSPSSHSPSSHSPSSHSPSSHSPSDLMDRLDLLNNLSSQRERPEDLRASGLDPGAVQTVERVRRQLQRLSPRSERSSRPDQSGRCEEALLISILAGYPDRVARRRNLRDDTGDLLLSSGGGANLSERSAVRSSEFLVAIEAEQRRDRSGSVKNLVHLASSIQPDWLIDLDAEAMCEIVEARWNPQSERVEVVERMLYDQLVIDERRASDATRPEVLSETARVLAAAAIDVGWQRFADPDEIFRFLWRIAFIGWNFPEAAMTDLGEADIDDALRLLCEGRRSFVELRSAAAHNGLLNLLRSRVPSDQLHFLNRMAPETVSLPGRRNLRINYEKDRAPWIASRLQDFIGLEEGPRIGGGRVPLVLHLLAPNNRPVQITTDLVGFRTRTYPAVRRELSRRYPRHHWPEQF